MKRRIILSILLIALAFGYCYMTRTPSTNAAAVEPAREPLPVSPLAAEAHVAAPIVSAASAVRVAAAPTVTDQRRRIFDSPDVLATIRHASATGTADEKSWALYMLVACVQTNARKAARLAGTGLPEREPSTPSLRQLVALKKQAAERLEARCDGVKALARLSDRADLQEALRIAAVTNQSVLGQLDALARSQDDRWNSEQAQQITSALYSGDPVLARDAFFTLQGAIDRDSPGGEDRLSAFMMALDPIYASEPLSEFERLGQCAVAEICGSVTVPVAPAEEPAAAVLRLADKYRAAVAARADARTIMAIR